MKKTVVYSLLASLALLSIADTAFARRVVRVVVKQPRPAVVVKVGR